MLQFIMLFAPACAAALIYERCSGSTYNLPHLVMLLLGFSAAINALTYAAIWLRGHDFIDWTSESVTSISFCVKYMGLSLVFAGILAVLMVGLSKIKAGKKND